MIIQSRKYTLVDFVKIPLNISPLWTILIIINRIINALWPSVQVLVTAKFIDTATGIFNKTVAYDQIFLPLFLIMGIIAYQYLTWSVMSIVNLKLQIRLTESFKNAIVEKRSKLQYRYIENNDTWDLINRACGDPVGRVSSGLDQILGAADLIIRVVSVLLIVMTQVWWAGLVMIAISVPLFYISVKAGKTNYDANKEAQKHSRKAGYLSGVLSSRDYVEERALFGYTDEINNRWFDKYETARKIELKVRLKNFIRMKSSSIMTVFISLSIIAVLIPAVGLGNITIGMFMGLVTATLNLVQMMSWQLSWIASELANSKEYLKDLSEFSALLEESYATDMPQDMSGMEFESIEFQHVSFQYPETDRYILRDCSFKLTANLHYAFVGVNGAGKTTITKLLTGMYDNFEGDILINHKSIREYTLPQLKGIFSVVYQDFAKYYIPFKDNIQLGNVLVQDDDRVDRAINTIDLQETVDKLPDGKTTWLGKIKENGTDLSGGEWQRVAIARSLYSDALVSILDEPTAALDPMAESKIYEMFGKISEGKSTIFITHRLGAAKLADEIFVIDEGHLAESGSHKELIEKGGIYAKMFESQKGWYANE